MGFLAPVGYDAITAIYHTYSFPEKGIAEYTRGYVFTVEQERRYLESIDAIFARAGLPKASEYADDFFLGRVIWAVVRMDDCPRLQKWRYEKLEKMLSMYMNSGAVLAIHKI